VSASPSAAGCGRGEQKAISSTLCCGYSPAEMYLYTLLKSVTLLAKRQEMKLFCVLVRGIGAHRFSVMEKSVQSIPLSSDHVLCFKAWSPKIGESLLSNLFVAHKS
jgi:hypothetical protein